MKVRFSRVGIKVKPACRRGIEKAGQPKNDGLTRHPNHQAGYFLPAHENNEGHPDAVGCCADGPLRTEGGGRRDAERGNREGSLGG